MRRALIALSILAVAAAIAAPAASAKVRQGPKGAAFYEPPGNAKGKHGTLIWARRQTGPDAIAGRRSRLLLYRSTGPDGKANAVSGSLALPKGKAPKGGWPVITYAHGTTGSADTCAPTRGYDANTLVSYAYPLLKRWLKAGYAVVRTDYEGLGTPGVHAYLGGPTEGYSVLDAVRAARTLEPRLSRRFVIAGHSQGGHAALFAASLAPSWTPGSAPARHRRVRARVAPRRAVPARHADLDAGRRPRRASSPSACARSTPPTRASTCPRCSRPRRPRFYPQTETECYDALSRPESFGGLPLNQIFRSGADLGPLVAAIDRNDPEDLQDPHSGARGAGRRGRDGVQELHRPARGRVRGRGREGHLQGLSGRQLTEAS